MFQYIFGGLCKSFGVYFCQVFSNYVLLICQELQVSKQAEKKLFSTKNTEIKTRKQTAN